MLIIANVLTMNGGTTFLIRICREFKSRGRPVAVLVLFPSFDSKLIEELGKYAKIFYLRDYLLDKGIIFRMQLMTFAPVRWTKLFLDLNIYKDTIHVMGVFGLFFASRMVYRQPLIKVTAGVYHQNEYLFKGCNSFFVNELRKYFNLLNETQIIFFNKAVVGNYSEFFRRDFTFSTVAPIGIDLPRGLINYHPHALTRMVSIGNLVKFKTYNRHAIGIVADLAEKYPILEYHIYGAGVEEQSLRDLAIQLKIEDKIKFKGSILYSEFKDIVTQSTIFIGSGTALLEAAALGVPSLIGIESIEKPETYGFLSDIDGYSYNEYMSGVKLVSMFELVDKLLADEEYAKEISRLCKKKAAEFSVDVTANRFELMIENATQINTPLKPIKNFLILISFLCVAMLDKIGISSSFRNRRNQSF